MTREVHAAEIENMFGAGGMIAAGLGLPGWFRLRLPSAGAAS